MAALIIYPTAFTAGQATRVNVQSVPVQGIATEWNDQTVFTCSSGTAQIDSLVVLSPTEATFILSPGANLGTFTIANSFDANVGSVTVAANAGFQLVVEDGSGRTNANSYATLDQANAYFAARLYATAWTGAATTDQPKALAMATLLIDATYKFDGAQTFQQQALAWPRLYCMNREQVAFGYSNATVLAGLAALGSLCAPGTYWSATSLPPPLVAATCEFAGELLAKNRLAFAEPAYAGIKSMNVGKGAAQFTFDPSTQPTVVPQTVALLLGPLGSNKISSPVRRLTRMG